MALEKEQRKEKLGGMAPQGAAPVSAAAPKAATAPTAGMGPGSTTARRVNGPNGEIILTNVADPTNDAGYRAAKAQSASSNGQVLGTVEGKTVTQGDAAAARTSLQADNARATLDAQEQVAEERQTRRGGMGPENFEGQSISDVLGDTKLSGAGGLVGLKVASALSNRSQTQAQRKWQRGMDQTKLGLEAQRQLASEERADRELRMKEGMAPLEADLKRAEIESRRADAKYKSSGEGRQPAEAQMIDYYMNKGGMTFEQASEEVKRAKANPSKFAGDLFSSYLKMENERILEDGEVRRTPEDLRRQAEEDAQYFFGRKDKPAPAAPATQQPEAGADGTAVPVQGMAPTAVAPTAVPAGVAPVAQQPVQQQQAVAEQQPAQQGNGQGKQLNRDTAVALLREAGGDKAKARQLAKERGYAL